MLNSPYTDLGGGGVGIGNNKCTKVSLLYMGKGVSFALRLSV